MRFPAAAGASLEASRTGSLIINADDWGRDRENTERTRECALRGAISSVSAMVFMEDSERAAAMARESGIDSGLHLNFTTPFTAPNCSRHLAERQQRIASYLRQHALARAIFHPGLAGAFEYVVTAQLEEYGRLYGRQPRRVDGHHHMHLCANVLLGGLLPRGTIVRRNFSFRRGEKSWSNRLYRNGVDRILERRHRLTDYFFSLPPLQPPSRVEEIFSLASDFAVEVETHPINAEEYRFLTEDEIYRSAGDVSIARGFALAQPPSMGQRGNS